MMNRPIIKPLLLKFLIILLLAAIYFITGKFGLSLAIVHKSATAVWPPTGIALAITILLGYWVWPGFLLGAFLVNITTEGTILTSLGIAIGNTLEALAGAFLVRKIIKSRHMFDRVLNVFKYILLAAILSPVISATFGVTSLSLGKFASWPQFIPIWVTWWMGDMVSALIIAPLILIWTVKHPVLKFHQSVDALFLFILIFLISQIVFGGWIFADTKGYPLEYLTIPLLLYAVFRFGLHGAVTATFLMSAIAIYGTLHGFGPFALQDPNHALLLLQAFLAIITMTGLILAAVISERERVEIVLRKREGMEKFRAVTETANDAIVCADSLGNIIYFNRAAKSIFGYRGDEALGQPLTILMPDRFHEAHRQGLKRYLETRQSRIIGQTIEIVGKKSDGTEFPIELSLASWKGKTEPYFSATIRDLTQQKQTEQSLARKNTFILLLQMVAVAANQAQTVEEVIEICLREICVHLGLPIGHAYRFPPSGAQELISTKIWYLKSPDRYRAFREVTESIHFSTQEGTLGMVLATGKPQWFRNIRRNPNFIRRGVAQESSIQSGFAFPVYVKTNIITVLEFFSDQDLELDEALLEIMTHLGAQIGRVFEREQSKEALQNAYDALEVRVEERTEELRRANEQLKKLDELKSNFILTASHELKTPLTSIKGYIMLILQEKVGAINAQQREFLGHVKNATDRLQRLLGDLLSISKIESGQVAMNKEKVKIGDVLKEEVSIFKAEAGQKKIALDLVIENDLGTIVCDGDKIREVLENLISNALKFTPANGKIWVHALRYDKSLEIKVMDTGIGIKQQDRLKIFEPFHHVQKKGLSGEDSTGLGLALVKRIVEAHQGQITVESQEGAGSTFTVILPY